MRAPRHTLAAALLGAVLAWSSSAWSPTPTAAQGRVHTVRAGDTLLRIARRYHVSVADLRRANRLRGENVRVGARLQIPRGDGAWRQARARRYAVRPGDTLARIARRFRTTVEDLRAANRLRGEGIRVGDSLYVPRPGQSGAQLRASLRQGNPVRPPDEPLELAEGVEATAERRASELQLGPTHVGQRLLREAPEPSWVEAARAEAPPEGTLQLPVDEGRYLRGWGSGQDGYHLAVDIGAPMGTDVHAAERGLVAYAGHGIRGYGNLVILVHANGWITGYAHNRVNLVIPGQVVERGALIARVGQSGFARGPHLHFILAFDGEHCDPTPLFTPRIQRANGEEVDEPVVVWDTDHRPSGIRCLARSARPHPHYHGGRRRRR